VSVFGTGGLLIPTKGPPVVSSLMGLLYTEDWQVSTSDQAPEFTINMAETLITLSIAGKQINLLISTGTAYSALSKFTSPLSPSFTTIIVVRG
jgi:hypothetical protein